MKKLLGVFFLIFILAGCAAKVQTTITQNYEPLDYREEVMVLYLNDSVPENAIEIGEVKVGDSGLTMKCDYSTVIQAAQMEARKAGGNAIKIIQHKTPDLFSSCHRITAKILKIQN